MRQAARERLGIVRFSWSQVDTLTDHDRVFHDWPPSPALGSSATRAARPGFNAWSWIMSTLPPGLARNSRRRTCCDMSKVIGGFEGLELICPDVDSDRERLRLIEQPGHQKFEGIGLSLIGLTDGEARRDREARSRLPDQSDAR